MQRVKSCRCSPESLTPHPLAQISFLCVDLIVLSRSPAQTIGTTSSPSQSYNLTTMRLRGRSLRSWHRNKAKRSVEHRHNQDGTHWLRVAGGSKFGLVRSKRNPFHGQRCHSYFIHSSRNLACRDRSFPAFSGSCSSARLMINSLDTRPNQFITFDTFAVFYATYKAVCPSF